MNWYYFVLFQGLISTLKKEIQELNVRFSPFFFFVEMQSEVLNSQLMLLYISWTIQTISFPNLHALLPSLSIHVHLTLQKKIQLLVPAFLEASNNGGFVKCRYLLLMLFSNEHRLSTTQKLLFLKLKLTKFC